MESPMYRIPLARLADAWRIWVTCRAGSLFLKTVRYLYNFMNCIKFTLPQCTGKKRKCFELKWRTDRALYQVVGRNSWIGGSCNSTREVMENHIYKAFKVTKNSYLNIWANITVPNCYQKRIRKTFLWFFYSLNLVH